MSLSLLQGYSSADEEEERLSDHSSLSDGDDDNNGAAFPSRRQKSIFDHPKNFGNSLLPSAFDAFAEIGGPPEFLKNSVTVLQVPDKDVGQGGRHGNRRHRKEKKDLPAGAIVEAKAQLVAIRDRVRSDIEGTESPAPSAGTPGEKKRMVSAANPKPEDAAELLRMCLQCGIPKTYSHTRGIVCPVCGDRPPADPSGEPEKKRGSTIKDKEKSKRMKGQSSHATWKSETEMQLRQHYD